MTDMQQLQVPVIGPLYSNWGFKNWLLHLHPDRIEAEPLGVGLSLKGGFAGSGGSQAAAQSVYAPQSNPSQLARRKSSESWPIVELEKIEVRRQLFTANEVRLHWHGGRKLVMAIGFRPSTGQLRTTLRTCYPSLYAEHRFKA